MSEASERRNPKVPRVELATLVDICALDGDRPPFQGQSANVSGRGMHVRTSHLPEIGQALVCRFEHEGREILVEGAVAWRAEGAESGEFGIQFTAVDADSAEILRGLRPMSSVSSSMQASPRKWGPASIDFGDDEDEELLLKSGDRVRLHIDGLNAPMKANVQNGTPRKVKVGSNLEFLKMGRPVEIESIEDGERRGARVDSVNVVVNPSTSIPELVVMLRYDGATPSPAPTAAWETSLGDGGSDERERASDEPEHSAADAWRFRAEKAWESATSGARMAGHLVSKAGSSAQSAFHGWMQKRSAPMNSSAPRSRSESGAPFRSSPSAPRRTTAGPRRPSNVAQAGLGVAPRRSSIPPVEPARVESPLAGFPVRRLAVPAVALAGVVGAWALWPSRSVEPAATAAAPVVAPAHPAAPAAPMPATAPAAAPTSPDGVVAEVPLFGPRSIAGRPADATPSVDEVALEKRAAAASVEDQAFTEPKAEAQATFGHGRLHLPTVHRIRLDGQGAEILGVTENNGFSVLVPGRKAMETGRAIEKRDRRILEVKTSNTAEGARVIFQFRGEVPPYRARLKNDFVEFLVSAPEGAE
jgi:PilZ domain